MIRGRILLTLGPSLTIRAKATDVLVGSAAEFLVETSGAVGLVTLRLSSSTLPGGEWTFTDNEDGTATLESLAANTAGVFAFTVEAEDNLRAPVRRRFSFEVFIDDYIEPFDACAPYSPPAATGETFAIGESAENDAVENVTEPTGGVFEICEEII